MKTNKKKVGDGKPSTDRKIPKQKPQFKKSPQKKRTGGAGGGGGGKKASTQKNAAGRPNRFTQAEERRLDRIRQQNERRAEKEAKLMLVQKEKKRKTKIFAKKNRHGQPLMSGRMELLLEKIQKRI